MSFDFDSSNFSDDSNEVTNIFFPLIPGTQFTYQGVSDLGGGLLDHQIIFTVTDLVRTIDGVNCVVVLEVDINDGVVREAELAFFAQDKDGNVWSLGEYPEEYENGEFTGAPNTWISGEVDAQGGVVMLADPQTGTSPYDQGLVPSIEFHDIAKVKKTGIDLSVAGESYTDVLVTREWDPNDLPAKQEKFYAPDVGLVKITALNDPEGETLELIEVRQLSNKELTTVRHEALDLEEHAYDISDVYKDADPAGIFDHGGDTNYVTSYITGADGGHTLNGDASSDHLNGGGGGDTLNGDAGKNLLHGQAGSDILDGGGGDDGSWGGKGADTFLFAELENGKTEIDTIEDYGVARRDLTDLPNGAGSVMTAELVNGVWQLALAGDGDVIKLRGIHDVDGNGILNDLFLV